ncbi:MAG: galactose mutarotase [Clostridia bacterium]|nr:galactose mutarotase [Clostridia bacterium]
MITKTYFGTTKNDEAVYKYTISSTTSKASVITFGATLHSFEVPSKNGLVDIVLGYDSLSSYETLGNYIGATVGRNSNRIKDGKFTLNGKAYTLNTNNGKNNLHGGNVGFSHRVWQEENVDNENNSLTLSIFSPDGEEGFPGNMTAGVKFTLTDATLDIEYFATCDQDTVCNFTNHSYFNLDGAGSKTAHENYLKINSDFITEVDDSLIPTGVLLPVKNTPFDFTEFKQVKKDTPKVKCYDVNYCLSNDGEYKEVAWAYSNLSGVKMTVLTDRPAVQLYGGGMKERVGKKGIVYTTLDSYCLETQTYPDAINRKEFPTAVLKKGDEHYTKTTFKCEIL